MGLGDLLHILLGFDHYSINEIILKIYVFEDSCITLGSKDRLVKASVDEIRIIAFQRFKCT